MSNETHFVIRIPRFAGYKTLFINAVVIIFGLAGAIVPQLAGTPLDPASVGVFYDTMTGAIIALIGLINVGLRLMTTTPAAPMKPSGSSGGTGGSGDWLVGTGEEAAYRNRKANEEAQQRAMLDALASGMGAVRVQHIVGVPAGLTVEQASDGMEHAEYCTFPHCACHQRCDKPQARPVVPGEGIPTIDREQAALAQNAAPHVAMYGPGLGRYLSAFFVPFFLVPMLFVATMTLGGCSTVQQVNAVAQASTLEQRAFAVYGTYVVLQERAADLVRDTSLPKVTRKRIQQADRIAHPLALQVRKLAVQLNAARMAYNSPDAEPGAGGEVARLTQAMGAALAAFTPALHAMQAAVNGARADG